MNKIGRTTSSSLDSVFIEKDQTAQIKAMKELVGQGSTSEIQKFFFSNAKVQDFDINKLVQNQINRHVKVLDHQNKTLLKQLLKQGPQVGKKPQELKAFQDQKTYWSMCEEDKEIQQYLSFDQDIDFNMLAGE